MHQRRRRTTLRLDQICTLHLQESQNSGEVLSFLIFGMDARPL